MSKMSATEKKIEELLADKHLSYLHAWEPGCYRAVNRDGEDLGFVFVSAIVAEHVNELLIEAGKL